jgi:flagellum-specific peptidoglycan hydrolase FlgJ
VAGWERTASCGCQRRSLTTLARCGQTVSPFRAYKSLTDSITDHDRLLQTASRYAAAMQAASDPREFAARLYEAGYSTDPDYADKLVELMDRYNLYSLDA